MTPELIIFDCDGVLIDSELISCWANAEELTSVGYPITTEQVIQRFVGIPGKDMKREIEQELGRPLSDDLLLRIEERTVKRYRGELRPMKDIVETVSRLNVPYCVASSSRPVKLASGLLEAGLFDLFYPHIFSTVLVERGKPFPDLFLYAARQMGVAPERCLVIEDSIAGVMAAKAAGMTAVGFTGGAHCLDRHDERLARAGADRVISRLSELPDVAAAGRPNPVPPPVRGERDPLSSPL